MQPVSMRASGGQPKHLLHQVIYDELRSDDEANVNDAGTCAGEEGRQSLTLIYAVGHGEERVGLR